MPLILGFFLLFAVRPTYAMGDPSVLYFFGGELSCLLFAAIWAAFSSRPWTVKGVALVPLALGFLGVIGLNFVPSYLEMRWLIEGAAVLVVFIAIASAIYFLRR